ncbi:MAG: TonB-dependent receptor [Bacteroidales bacterium]|nr:TonB-dependent receptor [Bacteroidales bacterium]MDD6622592.1 TonB-dependent receptor [Bacteroidales bacterium]
MKSRLLLLIACLLIGIGAKAQTAQITGSVVTETDGEPIIGATVMVKGTKIGTTTDVNGQFSITGVPANAKTLTVTYVGMKKAEVQIAPQVKVEMQSAIEELDEIMVVAYGTAKKSSYAGSASLVRADAIKDVPSTTFENALNGKVAGLQLTNNSGQAGSAPAIRIRGIGSMNAGNEPLYVIDGVPVSSGNIGQMDGEIYSTNNIMNSLNPDDIESISVLKDAAASSLYGSRAANGVILITTKKGTTGKPTINFKTEVGFTPCWATDNYETASVQDNVNMLYTVFHDYATNGEGWTEEEANAYALKQLNKKFNQHGYQFTTNGIGARENVIIGEYDNSGRGGKYYDWDKAYFRTATYQTYDFSVSGATDKTNYYTSLAYTKDEGRLKINSFKRVSGRVNLNQKVGKYFEFTTNASFAKTDKSGYNDTRSTGANYFMQTRNLLWGLYWPTDYKTGKPWTKRYGSYAYNGVYYDNEWENSSINTKLMAAETLTIHILPGLDVRSLYSYDNTNVKDHIYYSANHYYGSADNGNVTEYRTTYEKMVSSTTATYNTTIDKHTFGIMAGFEAEKNKTDYLRATGTNLPVSTLHTISTAGTQTSGGYSWGNSMASILSKVDYNFDDRYFISGSFRRDGSSRLSEEERWGNFWSVAGAWNIKKESFLADVDWLNNLRIRASYGVNGTLPSSNYGYMSLVNYTNKYMGNPGGTISSIGNNNLSWETSYNANVGIDFALLSNRLRGTVEFFNRDSKNLLQDVPISQVTGFSSTLQNIGRINNHGVEIEIGGDIITKGDWTWTASLNASFLSSKVKELYGGSDIIWYDPTGGDDRAQYIYREGSPTLSFYGFEWAGVDKTNGKSVYYVNDPDDPKAGDFLYNGRGATYDYDNANYTIIGNATPKVYGGINTTVTWKGLSLGLAFTYKIGGKLYDGAYKDVADDGYYWERIRAKNYFENLWTPENPNGSEPQISGLDLTDAMEYSSRHLFNASYLRLKSMTLGYTIPASITKKAYIQNARVFFSGTNLLTFSKYKDADPEVNEYGTRGWETPLGKTFVFGIELKF